MTDFFKSAITGIFNSIASSSDKFVGTTIEIGGKRLTVKKFIAEGGFGNVYLAENSSGHFAIKRTFINDNDPERSEVIKREIKFSHLLSGECCHVVQFFSAAKTYSNHQTEFILLYEYCARGRLSDLLLHNKLNLHQILQIFYHQATAVAYLHSKKPPVIHRDIKLENFLVTARGVIKLCDFGSATTDVLYPASSWTQLYRSLVEDELMRFTTPQYRSPEVLDTYSGSFIGPPVDMWCLGCILFFMAYGNHPFADASKLRILNSDYKLPSQFAELHPIICGLLQTNPEIRVTAQKLMNTLSGMNVAYELELKFLLRLSLTGLTSLVNTGSTAIRSLWDSAQKCSGSEALTSRLFVLTTTVAPSDCKTFPVSLCMQALRHLPPKVHEYLSEEHSNVAVLHSTTLGVVVVGAAAICAFYKLFTYPEPFLKYVSSRLKTFLLYPSVSRYINYLFDQTTIPHTHRMLLKSINLIPPLQCSIDIFCGERRVCASPPALQSSVPISATVFDDVSIVLRGSFRQKLCSLNFHIGYIPLSESEITFYHCDLDNPTFDSPFSLHIEFMFSTVTEDSWWLPWEKTCLLPPIVSSCKELQEIFSLSEVGKNSDFFLSDDWEKTMEPSCSNFYCSSSDYLRLSDSDRDSAEDNEADDSDRTPLNDIFNSENRMKSTCHFKLPVRRKEPMRNVNTTKVSSTIHNDDEDAINKTTVNESTNVNELLVDLESDVIHKPYDPSSNTNNVCNQSKPNQAFRNANTELPSDLFMQFDDERRDPVNEQLIDMDSEPFTCNKGKTEDKHEGTGFNFKNTDLSDIVEEFSNLDINYHAGKSSKPPSFNDNVSKKEEPKNFDPSNLFESLFSEVAFNESTKADEQHEESFDVKSKTKPEKTPIHLQASDKSQSFSGSYDPFDSLLNKQFSNPRRKAMTMREMQEKSAQITDPDTLKVENWVKGKHMNIRLLLSSLHEILWENETKWKPVGLHELVTPEQVKKVYRRALLAVHPDKLTDVTQQNLARMIFTELKVAWTRFEREHQ